MHEEEYEITPFEAAQLNKAKDAGKRIIAVGTTVVRALEDAASSGKIRPGRRKTRLYIRPGYQFQIVDGLITNFHFPRSTLLVLVCALLGYDLLKKAYEEAIKQRYRFFSFGDAMLIL